MDAAQGRWVRRQRDAAILGGVATAAVAYVRKGGEPLWILAIEGAAITSLLILTGWLFLHRGKRTLGVLISAVLTLVCPVMVSFLGRSNGLGTSWELVGLTTLGVGAMLLALLGRYGVGQRGKEGDLSVVCSGFLVLFTTSSADDPRAVLFAIVWAVGCLWWLVTNHWERLEVRLPQSVQRVPRVRAYSTFLGVLLFAAAAVLVWGRVQQSEPLSWGFMPTSGGERWSDPGAKKGVGNGDMVVAAREHASTFGPVETDVFMDSPEPSLFDMFDDTIGEPFKKDKTEKAIALLQQAASDGEGKTSESDQGGTAFTTARKPAQRNDGLQSNRSSAALQWIGERGEHLAMERWSHFDGIEWTEKSVGGDRQVTAQDVSGKPWFFFEKGGPVGLLCEVKPQAVKFLRLKSARIPAPATNVGVHIADVDREDFFAISGDDVLMMTGRETVPPQTVVRLLSRDIDGDLLRGQGYFTAYEREWQAMTNGLRRAGELAREWTQGSQRGWEQIESVVDHLREDFQWDRNQPIDPQDPLADFLSKRRGGEHLFATAATVMLQSLGYNARLVGGFYAHPDDYDRLTGETAIGADDAHVWVEVQISQGVWIPLEPTPGYLPPTLRRHWVYRVAEVVARFWTYGIMVVLAFGLIYWRRIWLVDHLTRFGWWLMQPLAIQHRIHWWGLLLDLRCRMARNPRPSGVPRRKWINEIVDGGCALNGALQRCFDAADGVIFGARTPYSNWQQDASCVVSQLTTRSLQKRSQGTDQMQCKGTVR